LSDIFEEVEEDVKRDRAIALWKKYGPYAIAAGVGVVLIAAAITWYMEYRRTQAEKAAMQFVAAADLAAGTDKARAVTAFAAIARDAPAGYGLLSRFYDAALKGQMADHAASVSQYRALAADSSALPELRSAATLLAAMHVAITASVAEVEREVAPLTAGDGPWRHVALELVAVAAIKAGDVAKARQVYSQIADDGAAPQALRGRAAEMLAALGT
jgi:hypothetical protein